MFGFMKCTMIKKHIYKNLHVKNECMCDQKCFFGTRCTHMYFVHLRVKVLVFILAHESRKT